MVTLTSILMAICAVESGGNWQARNGDCWGGLQISSVLVEDVNRIMGKAMFTHDDAYNQMDALFMGHVYLGYYAGRLGHKPTVRDYAGIWRHGLRGYLRGVDLDTDYIERVNNIVEAQ